MTDTSWAPARRRGRPPASDSAVTRERILQAAQKVFAESGYEAATFQAIAVEIGLTRPAINNYFHSKSALYGAVARRVSDTVVDAIHTASDAPTLADQLMTFIRVAIRGECADPSLAGFLLQSAIDVEHLPPGKSDAAVLVERFVRAAVVAAAQRGEIRHTAEGLTELLMGLIWGMVFQLCRGDDSHSDDVLDRLGVLLDHGLAA